MDSRFRRTVATAIAALALLAALPITASATYPGSADGRLAYGMRVDGNVDIYSSLANGQATQRLTTAPGFDACAAYSADGKRIAYCSDASGAFEIWTMRANGTHRTQLTDLGEFSTFPDISPDGDRVAFNASIAEGPDDIFSIGIDGSGLVQLTDRPRPRPLPGLVARRFADRLHQLPDRNGAGLGHECRWQPSDAADLRFAEQGPGSGLESRWSADRLRGGHADGSAQIVIIDADGSDPVQVTADQAINFGTAWSPDGAQIAFVKLESNGTRDVWIIGTDGTGAHRLAPWRRPPVRCGVAAARRSPALKSRACSRAERRLPGAATIRGMETLIDLLDEAARRYGERPALGLRGDDDATVTWSYAELLRRSRIAAWRLRALGLEAGERILTWSPSTPELPAVYFGAMRAGLVLVPLDLRMAPDAIERIAARAEAKRLIVGTGRDAPDPREAGLAIVPDDAPGHADRRSPTRPSRPTGRRSSTPGPDPTRDAIFELVFTSGTTGTPKGVMLAHDNVLASVRRDAPGHPADRAPRRLAAAAVAPVRAGGRALLRPRRRGRRALRPEPKPAGDLRGDPRPPDDVDGRSSRRSSSCSGRRSSARSRSPAGPRRSTGCAASPGACRTRFGASCSGASTSQLGGGLRILVSSGAFLPPALQQAWEDLGVIVIQGYGVDRDRVRDVHDPRGSRARDGRAARCRRSSCGWPTTARSSSAARRSSRATGTTPRRPRRPSPRTAGIGPATSAGSTTPGGSS